MWLGSYTSIYGQLLHRFLLLRGGNTAITTSTLLTMHVPWKHGETPWKADMSSLSLKKGPLTNTIHVVDHLDYIKHRVESRAFGSLYFTDIWLLVSGAEFSRTSSHLDHTLLTWEVSRTDRSACHFNYLAVRKVQGLSTLLLFLFFSTATYVESFFFLFVV